MNHRISNKIYKRAEGKLTAFKAEHHDIRPLPRIMNEENILSGLEKTICKGKWHKWGRMIQQICDELDAECI